MLERKRSEEEFRKANASTAAAVAHAIDTLQERIKQLSHTHAHMHKSTLTSIEEHSEKMRTEVKASEERCMREMWREVEELRGRIDALKRRCEGCEEECSAKCSDVVRLCTAVQSTAQNASSAAVTQAHACEQRLHAQLKQSIAHVQKVRI